MRTVECKCDHCGAITSWQINDTDDYFIGDTWERITIPTTEGSFNSFDLCPICYDEYKELRAQHMANYEIFKWIIEGRLRGSCDV